MQLCQSQNTPARPRNPPYATDLRTAWRDLVRSVDVHEGGHRALKSPHIHRRALQEAVLRSGHFDDDFAEILRQAVANEQSESDKKSSNVDVMNGSLDTAVLERDKNCSK
eukprot:592132_1